MYLQQQKIVIYLSNLWNPCLHRFDDFHSRRLRLGVVRFRFWAGLVVGSAPAPVRPREHGSNLQSKCWARNNLIEATMPGYKYVLLRLVWLGLALFGLAWSGLVWLIFYWFVCVVPWGFVWFIYCSTKLRPRRRPFETWTTTSLTGQRRDLCTSCTLDF